MGHAFQQTLMDALDPLPPHARRQHQLGGRHRPRRHRHADRGRAPAAGRRQDAPRPRPRSFVKRVWEWKQQSGATITRQMRRLGASVQLDLRRHRRPEGRLLHHGREDVARRGRSVRAPARRRPHLPRQAPGQLGSRSSAPRSPTSKSTARKKTARSGRSAIRSRAAALCVVATTRPETMLGDVAVAVNPEGRALRGTWSASRSTLPLARPQDPDHRRRLCRPRVRHRLRQDHAGARLQRLRASAQRHKLPLIADPDAGREDHAAAPAVRRHGPVRRAQEGPRRSAGTRTSWCRKSRTSCACRAPAAPA